MPYLDFDTLLICNNDFSEDSVRFTLEFFKSIGVKKFIFTYEYDRDLKPVSSAFAKFKSLKPYLRSLAPRGVRIYTAFNVVLSEGLVYDKEFTRFSFGHSDRIFISLPYDNQIEWLESDMNHLLYKNKQKPAFISFRHIDHSQDILNRLTAIKSSIFSMDINYMTSINSREAICSLAESSVNIVPCIMRNVFEYSGVLKSIVLFQNRIGIRNYLKICNNFYNSSSELIKNATFYPLEK